MKSQVSKTATGARRAPRNRVCVRTTLHEVIEELKDEFPGATKDKIVAMVIHLLDKGRIRFAGDGVDVEYSRDGSPRRMP